jgi:hypothetical protein
LCKMRNIRLTSMSWDILAALLHIGRRDIGGIVSADGEIRLPTPFPCGE